MAQQQQPAFTLPFMPYEPQQQLMDSIATALDSIDPSISAPVEGAAATPSLGPSTGTTSRMVAAELPTGTGKTVALLSAVLSWQSSVERKGTVFEQDSYFLERCRCNYCDVERSKRHKATSSGSRKLSARSRQRRIRVDDDDEATNAAILADPQEAEWTASPLFFQQFRTLNAKRLRVEGDQRSSSVLRKHHLVPPCTIFYATRTHSQLHQAVRELRRFDDAWTPALKFNILASRAHLCINRKVRNLVADKSVTVERNNLGELCDKLVAVHQCEAVESFNQLASRALLVPLHNGPRHRGDDGSRSSKGTSSQTQKSYAWDMEDLLQEGVAMNACPYYASRELVHFSNINFCTYMYLLDPVIRKECKFEAAVKNHSVIVFDEAHNVGPVCQDVLSVDLPVHHLQLIRAELEPLTSGIVTNDIGGECTMTYNRDFKLTEWTLRELFSFLDAQVIAPLVVWTECTAAASTSAAPDSSCSPSVVFAELLPKAPAAHRTGEPCLLPIPAASSASLRQQWLQQFKQIYGVVMALGVTFNPFNISVWALGVLKRILVVLRFALLHPKSFAVWVERVVGDGDAPSQSAALSDVSSNSGSHREKHQTRATANTAHPTAQHHPGHKLHIRCLDGSLALQHLARSCYGVILASGTLSPMPQLRADLKLPRSAQCIETDHVVDVDSAFRFGVLTRLSTLGASTPLLCNYRNLQSDAFLHQLTTECLSIINDVLPRSSGALVFVPNYRVAKTMSDYATKCIQQAAQRKRNRVNDGDDAAPATAALDAMSCLMEPREADKMGLLLETHRRTIYSQGKRSVIFSVYRGKVSEGLDFADDLGRLVLCVGLPLQPLLSRSVEAQRSFSGEAWYRTDAVKAVNQAMGRCLRHVKDYGAVVLMDERYDTDASLRAQLPKWCREDLRTWTLSNEVKDCLASFFQAHSRDRRHTTSAPKAANIVDGERNFLDDADRNEANPKSLFFGTLSGTSPSAPASRQPTEHAARQDTMRSANLSQTCGTQRSLSDADAPSRSLSSLPPTHSIFRSTALKLLYEGVDDVATVRRSDVDEALRGLEEQWGLHNDAGR